MGLGGDRRRLGHAVADRHLLDAGGDQLLHHLRGAGRARHDPGAHRGQVVGVDVGQRPLGDEHRRHAVERGAALVGHRLQRERRVEAGRRDHHRGPVRGAREVAHDHAEAVVEGHGDADAVGLGVATHLADEVAVVEDVAVAQGRALGEAGGAGGVLDVDRVARRQARGPLGQVVGGDALAVGQQSGPALLVVEVDHALQRTVLGSGLVHHGAVVARPERRRGDQQPHARLVGDVGELVGAVGRVDVDQDGADLRGGELHQRPLGAVRPPDADAVALADARTDQAARDGVDVGLQLRPGPAPPARALDQRLAVGVRRDGARQVVPDGLLQQCRGRLTLRPGVRAARHAPEPSPGARAQVSSSLSSRRRTTSRPTTPITTR